MRRPLTSLKTFAASAPAPVIPEDGPPTNYLDLYGLSRPPFGGPRDGNGYILFNSQKRAFELLISHIVNGSGVVLLQGEEGVGKTEMLRAAGDVAADSGVQIVRINRPAAGRANLAQMIEALGGPGAAASTTSEEAIQRFIAPPRKALLVDDVDLMPPDCVRLLLTTLNAASADPGGPAIALSTTAQLGIESGHPDLIAIVRLARNIIRTPRLGPAEVQQFIERSLWVAGGTTRRLISADALKVIVLRSGGVLASVDRLMEAAFTAGFARGDAMITAKTIAAMAGGAPRRPREPIELDGVTARALQIGAILLLVSGATLFLYKALQDPPGAAKITTPRPPEAPKSQPPPSPPPPSPKLSVSPPSSPSAKPSDTMSPDLMAALLKRGDQSMALGDTAAARLLFRHAADAGSAAAATALGKTYDPDYAAPGEKPDPVRAAGWYRKATELGDARAADLLKRLDAR